MTDRHFLPIGLPRDASSTNSVEERVGLHLLEALDSLDVLYKSAAYFAAAEDEGELARFTLTQCLDAVRCEVGAIFLVDDDGLHLAAEHGGCAERIRSEELATAAVIAGPGLWNLGDASALLVAGSAPANALTTPIHVGSRLAGMAVALAPPEAPFSTADAKLIGAVASQAAIALGRARHLAQIEIERQKLQLVVQNHHDGIAVLDQHGDTRLANPIARELLGDDVLTALQAIDPTLTTQSLHADAAERELTVGDGTNARTLLLKTRPLGTGAKASGDVVVTVRDLTRAKREERLQRNFVSLLSHKLRTPLTALGCAMHIIEGSPVDDHPALLADMSTRVAELGALVERLFQFTEVIEGSLAQRDSSDLAAIGSELAAGLASSPRPPELVLDLAADSLVVPLPPTRLRLALQNLVDNAIKFSPEPRPWVRIASRRVGNDIEIAVEDRGPGIRPSDQAAILAAFHQVDEDFTGSVPGAGVGIAIVREIVRCVGGTLRLHTASPHGCVFTLTVPSSPGGP